ncbi:endoplasmic reticulum aminopeptidase 2-like isoform X2 [Harmonia axyridis]|nr:endoplasmic reticulum aminopeptidase 2-like isoform X2 [Harmonia axyridis]
MQVFYVGGERIDPGEHILNIKYTGSFGFFLGFYKIASSDDHNQVMLATKFSSNHARSAFPCFDEPYFKSVFSIRLVKPNNSWDVISNMREIGRVETSKGIAVDFETTIPMSTYLLAWVYTDYYFDEINFMSGGRNIPLRFYNADKVDLDLREALKVTKRALTFFENYTDVPFPLAKLDSIAIPSYRSGGMEHYGLVVYQDHAVIYKSSPFIAKLYHSLKAALLICHEISHMWFGNLVTHPWYNDIWLTEGFARYMQFKAGVAVLGEPFVKHMFQESKFLALFQRQCEGDYNTETASYPRNLRQIGTKYGPSTYDQGGALLMMLEDLMGEEKFRGVVMKHLKGHQYGTSTTGEFIKLVEEALPTVNIRDVMESFLFQNKLPLMNVTIEGDFFVLRQSVLCNGGQISFFGDKWTIPIRYITSGNLTSNIILYDREISELKIPKMKDDKWIQINHLNNGLYRVMYSREIYKGIASDIGKLNSSDIGPLIEEAFFMSSLGKIKCDIPLKLIGVLRGLKTIDFISFTYASRSFNLFAESVIYDSNATKILKTYFYDIFGQYYDKLSWIVKEGESMNDRLLRMEILESFCMRYRTGYVYPKCFKDVAALQQKNITVLEDVDYIYQDLVRISKKFNMTMDVEDQGSDFLIEAVPTDNSCASWIKQNVPKFIRKKDNSPST